MSINKYNDWTRNRYINNLLTLNTPFRKDKKEGSVAASEDGDKGQKVQRRRADEYSIAVSATMGMIFA